MLYNQIMSSTCFETRIHQLLETVSVNILQMRLASLPDRNLAIALEVIPSEDRERILSMLPSAKKSRVEQEQTYLSRLKLTGTQKILMAEGLADKIAGSAAAVKGTWIAPGKSRK